MKRYLIKLSAFTLALAMVLGLASCGKQEVVETTTDVASVETVSDITPTQSTTVQTVGATEIVTDAEGNTQITTNQSSTTTNSDSKVSPTTKATTKTTQKSTQKATTKATTKKTTASSVKYAGKGDERAVAQAVIKWINYYRVQEGKKAAVEMPGKATQYAQGRSKQLVTNFDHSFEDEVALASSMKYGRKEEDSTYDPATDTITNLGTYFYRPDLSSAIGRGGAVNSGTADEEGKHLAIACKNSKGHWSYVGDADGDGYNYIAVGVSTDGIQWFVDIEMATENIDNTGYYK